MVRVSLRIAMAAILCFGAGCAAMQACVIDCEVHGRNLILSQQAWGEWSWCYDNLQEPFHFAKGFKAGYRNILEGGKGCQPTLPPKCYWKPHYQSPAGRCKINAWFDGFAHGALAAQQDGYGSLNEIPISPTARMNFESAKAKMPYSPYASSDSMGGMAPETMPMRKMPSQEPPAGNHPQQPVPEAVQPPVYPAPVPEHEGAAPIPAPMAGYGGGQMDTVPAMPAGYQMPFQYSVPPAAHPQGYAMPPGY
ncbi:MAG: hypothetical protein ACK50J_22170 [Planctomyces sp.]